MDGHDDKAYSEAQNSAQQETCRCWYSYCAGLFIHFFCVLQDAARIDHEQAKAVATNLIASIRSEISRNIEQYDLLLQGVVDELQMPELERIDPADAALYKSKKKGRIRCVTASVVVTAGNTKIAA